MKRLLKRMSIFLSMIACVALMSGCVIHSHTSTQSGKDKDNSSKPVKAKPKKDKTPKPIKAKPVKPSKAEPGEDNSTDPPPPPPPSY